MNLPPPHPSTTLLSYHPSLNTARCPFTQLTWKAESNIYLCVLAAFKANFIVHENFTEVFRSMLSLHSRLTGCVFRAPWVMLQHYTELNYLHADGNTCTVVHVWVSLRRRVWWLNGFFSQIKKHKGSFGSLHFLHLALGATFHFCYDLLTHVYSESQHALIFLLDWVEICPGHPISTADHLQVSY